MNQRKQLNEIRLRRKARVRSVIRGTAERPRLSVFRSNMNIYAQMIDDAAGKTIVSASSKELTGTHKKTDAAAAVGKRIAEKAIAAGVKSAVTDRGSYSYHGRLKALVEAARTGGLTI